VKTMMIDKLNSIGYNLPGPKAKTTAENNSTDFGETLKSFIEEVNHLQKEAGYSIEKLAAGEINDVHEVMVAVEKASVSFELMMEIRNKIVDAYRELMRMQV